MQKHAPKAHFLNKISNPFEGKILGTKHEATVRSMYYAMRQIHRDIRIRNPAMVLFCHSSGFPLYKIFKQIDTSLNTEIKTMILPVSTHNYHPEFRDLILKDRANIRNSTFEYASHVIKKSISNSRNPKGPIIIVDEVLSGSSITGILRRTKQELKRLGVDNQVEAFGICDQKYIQYPQDIEYMVRDLKKIGEIYVPDDRPEDKPPRYNDFQLTKKGLELLIETDIAHFKSKEFENLVLDSQISVYPTIRLFTTDNSDYNPLLILDTENYTLKAGVKSFSVAVERNVSELVIQAQTLTYTSSE